MKLLIMTLFSVNVAFAQNYVALEKEIQYGAFSSKEECEKVEQSACYETSKCDAEVCSVQDVQVDDFDRPIDRLMKEEPCKSPEACAEASANFCETDQLTFWGDRNEDKELEVWCVIRTFEKKIVRQAAPDSVKVEAKAERERVAREEKEQKARRKSQLVQKLQGSNNQEIRELLEILELDAVGVGNVRR